MTTQELLALFNSLILKNRWWSRFANSQFMKMMAVFAAQIIYYARMYAETALPEGFISTANKRSSILAAAEDRGYVARLVMPSTGEVEINNRVDRPVQLPLYATLWGENQYPYVLMETVNLPPSSQQSGPPARAKVSQMEKVTVSTTVAVGEEFYTVLLPKDITAKAVSLEVYVTVGGITEKWTENPQFRLANSRSKNYVVFYKPTEQLGVRFGDGAIGMMIQDNATIDIDVWTSEGDITLVSGQRLTPSGTLQYLANDIEILTATPVTNGAAMESTEETRNRAMYSVAYDDQIVWRGDYKFFLKGKIAGITWLNVWGESEEEKANAVVAVAKGSKDGDTVAGQRGSLGLLKGGILHDVTNTNTIFISAHKPGVSQADLKTLIMKTLNDIPGKLNKKFHYYDIRELAFSVTITGVLYTEIVRTDAMAQINQVLEERFGKDAETENTSRIGEYETVKVNDIWAAIQELKILSKFEVEINNMSTATYLNDFIFLDSALTVFDLSY